MEKEAKVVDFKRDYFNLLLRYHTLMLKRSELKRQLDEAEDFGADAEKEKTIENVSAQLGMLKSQIEEVRKEINKVAYKAEQEGYPLELENICKKYNLSQVEKDVLIALFLYRPSDALMRFDAPSGAKILDYIADSRADEVLFSNLFFDDSNLLRNRLIKRGYGPEGVNTPYYLSERVMKKILGIPYSHDEEDEEEEDNENEVKMDEIGAPIPHRGDELYEKVTPKVTLEDVVLPDEIRTNMVVWLKYVKNTENIAQKWGIKANMANFSNNVLLLYGPPGTGKTMLSEAIAYELQLPFMLVRSDQVLSCWAGNTEKQIVSLFRSAQKKKCVLFLDECDSLLSRRTDISRAHDIWENRMKNLFLQQMELFQGILIFATNFAENLDEAFERRIGMRIALPIPLPEEREKIWRSFFTNPDILADDVDFEKLARAYDFSGGFIKNAVLKAVKMCDAMGEKLITQNILEKAAQQEQESRWTTKNDKKVGFSVKH